MQVMSLAAEQHAWRNRDPALFFSGANLGFQRRNLSFTDWSLHRKEACPHTRVCVGLAHAKSCMRTNNSMRTYMGGQP